MLLEGGNFLLPPSEAPQKVVPKKKNRSVTQSVASYFKIRPGYLLYSGEERNFVLCPTRAALQRLQTFLDAASEVARKKKRKVAARLSHLKSASSVTIRTPHPPNCRVGIRGRRRSRDRVAHGYAGLVLSSRCRGWGGKKSQDLSRRIASFSKLFGAGAHERV